MSTNGTVKSVRVAENLWRSTMLPEGILERWTVATGAEVREGTCLAVVRIEDNLHDLLSPYAGRIVALVPENTVIEPGAIIAQIRRQ
jgi:biotin carboxyl carrier protein